MPQPLRDHVSGILTVVSQQRAALCQRLWPAWAEVATTDGRVLRSYTGYPKSDYQNALTWREMKDKFDELTAPVISGNRQDQIIAAIDALDEMDDLRELAELLVVNGGVPRP